MKVRRLNSDIISTLPQNVIENILTLLPIQDALRTSVLSRKWRYCWTSMSKLVFDDKYFEVSSNSKVIKKHKFVNAIFHAMLLHKGPITEFTLCIRELEIVSEIDQIILYLSRSNNVKQFIFAIFTDYYNLPLSFFSLQELETLRLVECGFEPPLTFNGFSNLKSLMFINVEITANHLRLLLTNCPQLMIVRLLGFQREDFTLGSEFTFIELLECLPSIDLLEVSEYFMKIFSVGGMPQKLPTPLLHLKSLILDVCFMEQDELSCVLCLIQSSPNLMQLDLMMYDNKKWHVQENPMDCFDLQDFSDFNLDRLELFQMENFRSLAPEMEFVKLIIAKSPVLKKARIELNANVSVDEERKMCRDLLRLPFQRASREARLVIERPQTST